MKAKVENGKSALCSPFPNKPWFLLVCSASLLKIPGGKREIAHNEQFLPFSHSVLYLSEELSVIFIKFEIVICKLFEFGSLKFVVLERVATF